MHYLASVISNRVRKSFACKGLAEAPRISQPA